MKKFIYTLIGAASLLTMGSCTDFLTEEVRGTENLETYFETPDQIEQYVYGCYFQIAKGGGWWQVYNTWLLSDMTTDDMWDGNTSQEDGYMMTTHFYPTGQEQGILQNFWGARYQGITTCNLGIEKISETNLLPESLRDRYVAEIRFLRAFFYFDLVRNFGGVPMVISYDQDVNNTARSTQEECYAWIEAELTNAAQYLPERDQLTASEMGRVTRGAALGILGKAQLYQGKWAEAKSTLQTIITGGKYQLLPNFGDVWRLAYNNSVESLFEVQQTYSDTYPVGGALTVVTGARESYGDGWAWGQPSSDLENAFLAMGDNVRLFYSIIKTGCTELPNQDPSLFKDFIDSNSVWGKVGNEAWKEYQQAFGWTDDMFTSTYLISPAIHKSSRIIGKYFLPSQDRPEVYNIDKIPLNHRVLRYADVLLMAAEACNETGDDATARNYLNQVRNRVGLANVNSSGNELREAIRAERRLELCNEQCRLYDIRRWDAGNGKKVMENLFGPNGTFVQYNTGANADMYEKWNQKESSDKGIRFTAPRDLLYPIPLYEIQHSNGLITQNPGW